MANHPDAVARLVERLRRGGSTWLRVTDLGAACDLIEAGEALRRCTVDKCTVGELRQAVKAWNRAVAALGEE